MNEVRHTDEYSRSLKSCPEFRNADIKAFVRHLHERRCQQCLTLFRAAAQGTSPNFTSPAAPKPSKMPVTADRSGDLRSNHRSNDRSLDRWLAFEYFLIPQRDRPLLGTNDWFRWLDEFQQRHPLEVSRITEPLAKRASQVLWNSR